MFKKDKPDIVAENNCGICVYWSDSLGLCRNSHGPMVGQIMSKDSVCDEWEGAEDD